MLKYGMALAGILVVLALVGVTCYMWIVGADVPAGLDAAFWVVMGWLGKAGFDATRALSPARKGE